LVIIFASKFVSVGLLGNILRWCIDCRLHENYLQLQKLNHTLETKLLATVSFFVLFFTEISRLYGTISLFYRIKVDYMKNWCWVDSVAYKCCI